MEDKIKFIIPGKPEYLTMVRLAIGSIADTAQFNMDELKIFKQLSAKHVKQSAATAKKTLQENLLWSVF